MTQDIQRHYRELLHLYGDSHKAAQYSSRASQEERFRILTEIADLDGASILDFGCGTAQLATFLRERGITCHYSGVDFVAEFLSVAQAKHPQDRFGTWDELKDETFDYAFVSGVFNNRIDDNEGFFRTTVAQVFRTVRRGFAFNMMSTYVDYQDPDLFYMKPEAAFAYAKSLTPYVTLRSDYQVKPDVIPFEFAVYMYRR